MRDEKGLRETRSRIRSENMVVAGWNGRGRTTQASAKIAFLVNTQSKLGGIQAAWAMPLR